MFLIMRNKRVSIYKQPATTSQQSSLYKSVFYETICYTLINFSVKKSLRIADELQSSTKKN